MYVLVVTMHLLRKTLLSEEDEQFVIFRSADKHQICVAMWTKDLDKVLLKKGFNCHEVGLYILI